MFKTKSLLFKSIVSVSVFLLNIGSCMAMHQADEKPYVFNQQTRRFYFPDLNNNYDLDPTQVHQDYKDKGFKGSDPNEIFNQDVYMAYITKLKNLDKELINKTDKANIEAQEKEAETKRKQENERLQATAPTYQSTHAAPLLGSKTDEAQSTTFAAQARFHDRTANSLQYNNYYTVAKDGTQIITRLIAPSLTPALSPVFFAARQKYLGKTTAEIESDNDTDKLRKAKNAHDLASIKEVESRDLANLSTSLHQGCGGVRSEKGLEECIESVHLLAKLNLHALQDLEKRQKETSALN